MLPWEISWNVKERFQKETDDELRERIMEANEQMDDSYIGNESDYKRWAESVAGIGTAIVVPEWNGPEAHLYLTK